MLDEIAKSRVRTHMGVPVAGIPDTGSQLGYRYAQKIGQLEFRMNNMQPLEEAQLTGCAVALLGLTANPAPTAGDTVTVTINALPALTYTVQPSDLLQQIPLQAIAEGIAAKITAAGIGFLGNYGISPQAQAGVYGTTGTLVIQPTPATSTAFTVAVAYAGQTVPFIRYQGNPLRPFVTFNETGETVNGYIAICDYLESLEANAADLIKYAKADVVNFRLNEQAERANLYHTWRQKLADFVGIPLFPMGRPKGVGGGFPTGMRV